MKNENIITFGCRLNSFDSQIIREKYNSKNLNNIYFINTCAVTKEAEKQAKKKEIIQKQKLLLLAVLHKLILQIIKK